MILMLWTTLSIICSWKTCDDSLRGIKGEKGSEGGRERVMIMSLLLFTTYHITRVK